MQAQPISGAIPELVQLLQRAALATEAEGRVDLAHALRWWAEQLEPLAKSEDPRRPEMWIG
jgi:hypothetical protein